MSFIIQWCYVLSLAVWVGSMVFFSFVTTPTVFTSLPRELSGQLLAALFPRYYLLGYVCGGAMLLCTLLEAALVRQLPWLRVLLIVLMLGSSVYAGSSLRPQIHDLKIQMKTVEEGTAQSVKLKERFDGLHRLSVILNMACLAIGLALLGILAFRLRL